MTIYTTATKPVEVITKNATPYDVDGNKGITYRLVVMADNDVEKLKVVDEKTYNLFQPGHMYGLSIKTFLSHGVRKRLSPSPM